MPPIMAIEMAVWTARKPFADFALACADMGYKAFKIHGWHEGNIREEAELVLHVRKMVGDDMTLMLDPACQQMLYMWGAPVMKRIFSGWKTPIAIAGYRLLLIGCAL